MKIDLKRITVSLLILLSVQMAFANYAFYNKVKNTCDAYRMKVKTTDMSLTEGEFNLTLTSNRNNFEMVMLVGFASAGQAIKHQKFLEAQGRGYQALVPSVINVIVNVPLGRDNTIISATADANLVEQLADGTIDTTEFINLIKDSIQSL